MMKHHLNLEKEVQSRDYDGIVAHTTIVMTRNIFLTIEQRCHDNQRTIGGLFFVYRQLDYIKRALATITILNS